MITLKIKIKTINLYRLERFFEYIKDPPTSQITIFTAL